jgi:hypothetical protein
LDYNLARNLNPRGNYRSPYSSETPTTSEIGIIS